jgi:hypothetical protein
MQASQASRGRNWRPGKVFVWLAGAANHAPSKARKKGGPLGLHALNAVAALAVAKDGNFSWCVSSERYQLAREA